MTITRHDHKIKVLSFLYKKIFILINSSGPRKHRKSRVASDQKSVGSAEKRTRTNFDPSQLATLRAEFDSSPYLSETRRKHLATSLSLQEIQVKIWFQNRRAKLKKSKTKKAPPHPDASIQEDL